MNGKESGAGRPLKMENWVIMLRYVLTDENILFLSDKDLVFLVNQNLPNEQRIDRKTFERWKAGEFHPQSEDIGSEFMECIEKALIKQKQYLGEKLMNDTTGQWVRWAWILERKFAEYNLKHISENINKNEQSNIIQITAGSQEQKNLIDNILNVDFEEIKPEPINQKLINNNDKEDNNVPF